MRAPVCKLTLPVRNSGGGHPPSKGTSPTHSTHPACDRFPRVCSYAARERWEAPRKTPHPDAHHSTQTAGNAGHRPKKAGGSRRTKVRATTWPRQCPACTVRDASRRGVWRQVAPCDWAASENRWEIMRASWGRRLLRVPNPSRLGVFRFGTAECMCGKWSAR